VAAALLAPAVFCVTVAAADGPPVRVGTFTEVRTTKSGLGLTRLSFEATNTSGSPLALHFASSTAESASRFWKILKGPATLGAHSSASYVLEPRTHAYKLPNRTDLRVRLRIFTDSPLTVSSADVPLSR
jgi:hypothetical protein